MEKKRALFKQLRNQMEHDRAVSIMSALTNVMNSVFVS